MITVDEALNAVFALASETGIETVSLREGLGRVLAKEVATTLTQPPFSASAMDGYAVRDADLATTNSFRVIGEAAAGSGFSGAVNTGDAVRIFTGAPVPEGADRVILQEDVTRTGDRIDVTGTPSDNRNIRAAGADFRAGETLAAPRRLTPADLALLAAMNIAELPARRKPIVALIATGDELVVPGETPGPDQIVASNTYGLAALVEAAGGHPRLLPIARDSEASLTQVFGLAEGADLIVTIGGASVGDHDLVGKVAKDLGLERAFYKIAMRPGKPLMAGRLNGSAMLGLPGNPVSAMVCGHLFLVPLIRAMLGLGHAPAPRKEAVLLAGLDPNGPREHYMRARVSADGIRPFDRQDSSLLSILSEANALLVRAPKDGAREVGEIVEYVPIGG